MQFSATILSLIAATGIMASPIANTTGANNVDGAQLEKLIALGIEIFTGFRQKGTSERFTLQSGVCFNVPEIVAFEASSMIREDPMFCRLYNRRNCNPDASFQDFGGSAGDINGFKSSINDRLESMFCQ